MPKKLTGLVLDLLHYSLGWRVVYCKAKLNNKVYTLDHEAMSIAVT
jgi:hypothetical protein